MSAPSSSTTENHNDQVRPCPADGMDNTKLAIDIPELAVAIGANVRSLRNAFYLRPEDFPPAHFLPGCRGVRFLVADLPGWLGSHRQPQATKTTTPKPKGRPRKASPAQIASARKAQGGAA